MCLATAPWNHLQKTGAMGVWGVRHTDPTANLSAALLLQLGLGTDRSIRVPRFFGK